MDNNNMDYQINNIYNMKFNFNINFLYLGLRNKI